MAGWRSRLQSPSSRGATHIQYRREGPFFLFFCHQCETANWLRIHFRRVYIYFPLSCAVAGSFKTDLSIRMATRLSWMVQCHPVHIFMWGSIFVADVSSSCCYQRILLACFWWFLHFKWFHNKNMFFFVIFFCFLLSAMLLFDVLSGPMERLVQLRTRLQTPSTTFLHQHVALQRRQMLRRSWPDVG